MIVADTDVLIDFLTGVEPAKDQVAEYIKADQLQTTAISCSHQLFADVLRSKS